MLAGIQGFQTAKKQLQSQKETFVAFDIMHTTLQFLTGDIQASGYRGRRSTDNQFPLNHLYQADNPDYQYFRFDRALYGFEAAVGECYGKLPKVTCEQIKEASEVLILYNVPQKITPLKQAMSSPASVLYVGENPEIWENSLVLISDDLQGDLFITAGVKENKIYHPEIVGKNKQAHFSKSYDINADVVELQTIAYFVATSESVSKENRRSSVQRYGLYRKDLLHRMDEIVSGIIDLHFEYALLSAKDFEIVYKTSPQMSSDDWPKVKSVRVHITTEKNRVLTYEIFIRNGYGFNHSHDFSLKLCGGIDSCFDAELPVGHTV